MHFIHNAHADGLTWTILATFALFWIEEIVQISRKGTTLSKLLGSFEGESTVRHVLVAIPVFILMLHLAFFP